MKHCIFLLSFCSVLFIQAQISLPNSANFDTTINYQFGLSSSEDVQTSSIPNSFSSILIKGGAISNETSSQLLEKQNEINRVGRDFCNDIFFADYKHRIFKQDKYGFVINLGYHSVTSVLYGKDLFELAFKGNAGFLGDTAEFGGSGFKHFDFQNFGFGLIDKKTKSYATLNFVRVQNYFDAQIDEGTYSLSSDSSSTSLSMKGFSNSAVDTNFIKGVGISVNLCLNFTVPWQKEKTAYFQLMVRDLGIAKINQINTLSVDTTLDFSGFQMDDFLQSSNTNFGTISWLDTLNVKNDTLTKNVILPVSLQFGKILNANYEGKIQSFFGIKMYPTMSYVPKIYLGLDYKIKSKFHLGASCSYGGFGTFRAGMYANYAAKKINVGAGTEDIYGLVSKRGFGQMFNIKLLCTF